MRLLQLIKDFFNTPFDPNDPFEDDSMTEANTAPQLNAEDTAKPETNEASAESPQNASEEKIGAFITKFKAGIKIVENVTDEAIEDVAEFVKKYV